MDATKFPYSPPAFDSGASLALYNVPLAAYLSSNPSPSGAPYHGIATGSLVIDTNTSKILLVQRAPHDSMPLRWETPGGAVDMEDESILHGAARELYEETGLVAKSIGKSVGGMQEFCTRRGLRMSRVSFLVDVQVQNGPIEVTLDPNEHVQYVWATEEQAKAKKVGDIALEYTTEAQEQTVYQAFEVWRQCRNGTCEQ